MSKKDKKNNPLPTDLLDLNLTAGCSNILEQEGQECDRRNVTSDHAIAAMINRMSELSAEIRTMKCQADDHALLVNGKLDSLIASNVCLSERLEKMENLMIVHREALGEVKTATGKPESKRKPQFDW